MKDTRVVNMEAENGTLWQVPVMVIALNCAKYYADEYGGDTDRALREVVLPLFEDSYEIIDWLDSNMNADELTDAVLIRQPTAATLKEAHWSGDKSVVDGTKETSFNFS